MKRVYHGFDSIYKSMEFGGKAERKMFRHSIRNSKEYLMSLDTAGLLMHGDPLTAYLQKIADKILTSNPALAPSRNVTVFTYRTGTPNAFNMGNGVILFNLDLLAKLENEAEIAYIMAHEISHDLMDHVMATLHKTFELSSLPEFKQEAKKIKAQSYNRAKAYDALITRFLIRFMRDRRIKELEADSLGFLMYAKAGYPPKLALRAEKKLDSIDQPAFTSSIDLRGLFDDPSVPFKDWWLLPEEQEDIGGNYNIGERPDSLKTHPDCKVRLAALERISDLKLEPANGNDLSDNYKILACFELLEHNMAEFDLGNAFYYALQLLKLYPDNEYLKCSFTHCLYELYKAKEDHYFSLVAVPAHEHNIKAYNDVLIYLLNVNSEALKTQMLNYYHAHVHGKIKTNYAAYVAALIHSTTLKRADREKLAYEYKKKYKDPHYTKLLENKFKPKP